MSTLARLAVFVLATFCALGAQARAAVGSGEYDVKAAFLFNFAKFVQWPPEAFSSTDSPFAICVLGQDPFGATLDATVRGERIQGRPLVVRRLEGWDDAELCQILFVSTSVQEDFVQLLGGHTFRRTLTVGEVPQFLRAGGHISFFVEENRVRFAVNRDSLARTDLQVSSKLMRVARPLPGSTGGTR